MLNANVKVITKMLSMPEIQATNSYFMEHIPTVVTIVLACHYYETAWHASFIRTLAT